MKKCKNFKNKKAQITLFVIISMSILIVIVMIVFLKNSFNTKEVNEKQNFLDENCINEQFYKEMELLGKKGGVLKNNNVMLESIDFNDDTFKIRYGIYFLTPTSVYDWNFLGRQRYGVVSIPKLDDIKKELEESLKEDFENECKYTVDEVEVFFNDEKTLLFAKIKFKENENYKNVRIEYDLPFKKMYEVLNLELNKEVYDKNHEFESFYNEDYEGFFYPNINGRDDLFVLRTKNNEFNGKKYYFYTLIKDRLPKIEKKDYDCKISFFKNHDKYKFRLMPKREFDRLELFDVDEKDVFKVNYDYEILECTLICEGNMYVFNKNKEENEDEIDNYVRRVKSICNIDSSVENFFKFGKIKTVRLISDGNSYEGTII